MDLSIIVPVYNRQHTIHQALEASRKAVDKLTTQWIIVDDGSEDASAQTCQDWSDNNPGYQVEIIRQENKGAAAARNAGLSAASGRYILFLDSDDVLLPDWLPTAAGQMDQADEIDITYTGYRIIDGHNEVVRTSQAFKEDKALQGILTTWVTHPDVILYRKTLLDKTGGFREDMPAMQDHEFTLRAFLKARKRKRLRGYGVDVREEGADRISAERFSKSQPDVIAFLKETVNLLREHGQWQQHAIHWQTRCESYIYQFLRNGRKRDAAEVARILNTYADQFLPDKVRFGLARILPPAASSLWYRKTSRKIW